MDGNACISANSRMCNVLRDAFKPGFPVPKEAMYWVHHYQHRVSHLSYLRAGENFPTCARCGDRVRFELAPEHSAAAHISQDTDFGGNSSEREQSKAG